jgi:hypothetical protein
MSDQKPWVRGSALIGSMQALEQKAEGIRQEIETGDCQLSYAQATTVDRQVHQIERILQHIIILVNERVKR